jgi:hypothetical protein
MASDNQQQLKSLWFSGEEWRSGFAMAVSQLQFQLATGVDKTPCNTREFAKFN